MWAWATEHPYLFSGLVLALFLIGPREAVATAKSAVQAFRAPINKT